MAQQQTYLWIATEATLVTVQNHQNWSESLTQIRSANFHGTRELLEFFVDYTETVKSAITQAQH